MGNGRDREQILVVVNEAEIGNFIARQTLTPLGYRVKVSRNATAALQAIPRILPDLIIADLDLPDLSGKDLLVALTSQGFDLPLIVLSKEEAGMGILQAFRLGAADFIFWPAREAEIISAVDRVLKQVRARRQHEVLSVQLNQKNQDLTDRIHELTTLLSIGKVMTSLTDQHTMLTKIMDIAVQITRANCGWLLVRQENEEGFILDTCYNLPPSLSSLLNKPWDDGLSSWVAKSGETLSIYGEPLNQFKVSKLGKAALVVPVKAKNETIGLLVVMRAEPKPFEASSRLLLEAAADYASVSLTNARLLRALEGSGRLSSSNSRRSTSGMPPGGNKH
jgi:DNA-binding response OmpR family regulator